MEEEEDGCLTVVEKNGLGPAAAILEDYGIDSETDLLVLVRIYNSKLEIPKCRILFLFFYSVFVFILSFRKAK